MSLDAEQKGDPVPAIFRELAPPRCSNCDYPLTGLPSDTNCPECGTPSEPNVITITGWSRWSLETERRNGDLIIGVIVLIIVGSLFVAAAFKMGGEWVAGASLAVVIALGYPILRRLTMPKEGEPPVRLRLGPDGFEQRVGPGPLKLRGWHRDMRLSVRKTDDQWHRLRIKWSFFHLVVENQSGLIDIEINADAEHAAALKSQINDWVRANRNAARCELPPPADQFPRSY